MDFNIAANQEVDTIDKVPSDFQGLYKKDETSGKFKIDSEHAGVAAAVAVIGKLNNSLVNERKTKRPTVDLAPLAAYGATVEEIANTIDVKIQEAAANGDKTQKINLEKIKDELNKQHSIVLGNKDKENTQLRTALEEQIVDNVAYAAISEMKGIPELIMPYIKAQVKVVSADGKFFPRVVDDAGEIRYSGTTGEPLTIKELVASMKKDEKFGRVFESEAGSGGGTSPKGQQPPGAAGKKPIGTGKDGELTPNQKIAAGMAKRKM